MSEETSPATFTVTSTSSSSSTSGTLAWAIAQANALDGACVITISDSLAGQSFASSGELSLNNPNASIILGTGAFLPYSSSSLSLADGTYLEASGTTFGEGQIILATGAAVNLSNCSFEASYSSPSLILADTSVALSGDFIFTNDWSSSHYELLRIESAEGDLSELWKDCTISVSEKVTRGCVGIGGPLIKSVVLSALPEGLTGEYRLVADGTGENEDDYYYSMPSAEVVIDEGETLTIEEGAALDLNGAGLTINGTLSAKFAEVSDALIFVHADFVPSSDYYDDPSLLKVGEGGLLELENANINLGYEYVYSSDPYGGSYYVSYGIEVGANATFSMVNGEIGAYYHYGSLSASSDDVPITVKEGGEFLLNGTKISGSGPVELYGYALFNDVTVSPDIEVYGDLSVRNSVLDNCEIHSSGKLNAKDSTLGYFKLADGDVELNGCDILYGVTVYSSRDVLNMKGGRNIFTEECTFLLNSFTGDTADLWTGGKFAASKANSYVALSGVFYDSILRATPVDVSGGYEATGNVSIWAGYTMQITEGAVLHLNHGGDLNVNGTLMVHTGAPTDIFVSALDERSGGINVNAGGRAELDGANIRLLGEGASIEVAIGGELLIRDAEVATAVHTAGTIVAEDVTFTSAFEATTGSITLTNCTFTSSLSLSNALDDAIITGCDLSAATISIIPSETGTGLVDLAGNYWGTTNLEEIKARIQGYDPSFVVIGSILSEPPTSMSTGNPALTLVEPQTQKIENGLTRVTLTWSGSEDATYELMVDGNVVYSGSDSSYSIDLPDGVHRYLVTATNAHGKSSLERARFELDATAPALELGETIQYRLNGSQSVAVLSWKGEPDVTYTLSIDGVEVYSGTENHFSQTVSSENHIYTISATDDDGNCTEKTGSITYDARAPYLFTVNSTADSAGTQGTLAWAVAQANACASACRIVFDSSLVGQRLNAVSITLNNPAAVLELREGVQFTTSYSAPTVFNLSGARMEANFSKPSLIFNNYYGAFNLENGAVADLRNISCSYYDIDISVTTGSTLAMTGGDLEIGNINVDETSSLKLSGCEVDAPYSTSYGGISGNLEAADSTLRGTLYLKDGATATFDNSILTGTIVLENLNVSLSGTLTRDADMGDGLIQVEMDALTQEELAELWQNCNITLKSDAGLWLKLNGDLDSELGNTLPAIAGGDLPVVYSLSDGSEYYYGASSFNIYGGNPDNGEEAFVFDDGASLNLGGHNLTIRGTVRACYTDEADALTYVSLDDYYGSGYYEALELRVAEGASLELENANINLGNYYSYDPYYGGSISYHVYVDGTLSMENGEFKSHEGYTDNDDRLELTLSSTGQMQLTGTDIYINSYIYGDAEFNKVSSIARYTGHSHYVYDGGFLTITDSVLEKDNVQVNSGATLTASGTVFGNTVLGKDGATLELNGSTFKSVLTLQGCETSMNNCSLAGGLAIKDATALNQVSGSGNIFSGGCTYILDSFSGNTTDLWGYAFAETTQENSYVEIKTISGDTVLSATPSQLAGGYHVSSWASVSAGALLKVMEGAVVHLPQVSSSYGHLSVYGALEAKLTTATDVFVSESENGNEYLKACAGGRIELENANIRLKGSSATLQVEAAVAETDYVAAKAAGELILRNLEVEAAVTTAGNMTADGVSFRKTVKVTAGTAALNNSRLESTLTALGGELELNNSSLADSFILSNTSCLSGSGNQFTGQRTFILSDFSGNTADLWTDGQFCATQENSYVCMTGSFGDTILEATPELVLNEYHLIGDVTVANTMQLMEGVTINFAPAHEEERYSLDVVGNLIAVLEQQTDVFVSDAARGRESLNVLKGGRVELEHANIRLRGEAASVSVRDGGELILRHAEVTPALYSEGSVVAEDTTFSSDFEATAGVLKLTNCTLSSDIVLANTLSEVTITRCDLSEATITIVEDEGGSTVIDLSGNYWGTTNRDEIISRIEGYSAERVLLGTILPVDPTQHFVLLTSSLPYDKIKMGTESITFSFSRELDASTCNGADTVRLLDAAGNAVELHSVNVQGRDLTITFDAMTQEGKYYLHIGDELRDINGDTLAKAEGTSAVLELSCDGAPPHLTHMEPEGDITGTLNEITLYFSEAIETSSLLKHVVVRNEQGNTYRPIDARSVGLNAYAVTLPAETQASGIYTVSVEAGVHDLAGNGMVTSYEAQLTRKPIKLTISSLEVEQDLNVGSKVNVTWSGHNETGYALSNAWTDGIYLSRNGVWDIDDIKLGELVHGGGLAAGESFTETLTVSIPCLAPGDYQILVRSDIYGQSVENKQDASVAQNLQATPVHVAIPTLNWGEPMSGKVSTQDAQAYYLVPKGSTMASHLVLEGLGVREKLRVYIAYDREVSREDYDLRVDLSAQNGEIILPDEMLGQDAYLLIERSSSTTEVDYTLRVEELPLAITSVQSSTRNAAKDCELIIDGVNFDDDAQVILLDAEGREYHPADVKRESTSRIRVNLPADTLAQGTYDVRILSGGESVQSEDALTLKDLSGSNLRVSLSSSTNVLDFNSLATFTISYENTGYDVMDAPLLIFTLTRRDGEQEAFLTTKDDDLTKGFWSANRPDGYYTTVAILPGAGTGTLMPTGRDDVLEPEETSSLANVTRVYYAGWATENHMATYFEATVSQLTVDNKEKIDWEGIVESAGLTGTLAAQVAASLESSTGSTWGEYVQTLHKVASRLTSLGADASSEDVLLNVLLSHAMGAYTPISTLAQSSDTAVATSAQSLEVTRFYSSTPASHSVKGIFGYGWQSNWDIALEEAKNGDVSITIGGTSMTIQKSISGGYVNAGKNDDIYLKKQRDGSFVLTAKNGNTNTFSKSGKLLSQVDEYGNSLSFSYDSSGNMVKVAHSCGAWLEFTYNGQGFVSSVTNSYGETTNYTYDDKGNMLTAVDYRGQEIHYSYQNASAYVLSSLRGGDGVTHEFGYNEQGILSSTSSLLACEAPQVPGGYIYQIGYNKTTIEYPEAGVVKVTDAYGASSTYYYDGDGNLLKALDAYGNAIHYSYNDSGKLSSIRYQDGTVTSYRYDKNGNVTSTTNAIGATVTNTYDSDSRLTKLTDAMGHSLRYTYDSHDKVTSIQYEDGTVESWTYDAKGNTASWTQQDGTVITYTYDKVGNVLTSRSSEGAVWTYNYDAKDALVGSSVTMASADSSCTTTYTYDERHLLVRMEQDGHSVSYTYDDKFRCTSMVDEQGNTTSYNYDRMGRLTSVYNGSEMLIDYEYDNIGGRLLRETKGNGTSTAYTYTLTGQVESITNYAADGVTVQSSYRYTYDKVGLVTRMDTHEGTWNYSYDAIGQLLRSTFIPAAGSSASAHDMRYEYDLAGNRTRSIINGVETLYTNDAMNRTTQAGGTSYEYDTNGNLILETAEDGATTTHEYNELNKLVRTVTSSGDVYTYNYDAAGNRISMSKNGVATHYSYDASGNLINEYDASGNQKVHYDYGNNLIGFDEAGEYYHTQGDLLGSVTGVTDESGNLVQTGSWDSYGNQLEADGSSSDASLVGWLGSLGLMTDEDGKTYMRARYYDASLGKFITSDPIGGSGGLNTYAYCGNNGVSYTDSSGLARCYVRPLKGEKYMMKGLSALDRRLGIHHSLCMLDDGTVIDKGKEGLRVYNDQVESSWIPITPHLDDGKVLDIFRDMAKSDGWWQYSAINNNCNFFIDALLATYKDGLSRTADSRNELEFLKSAMKDKAIEEIQKLLQQYIQNNSQVAAEREGKNTGNGYDVGISLDPNDLTGTHGYGEENFIAAGQRVSFKLECQNDAEATAPARWIRLYTTLDEAYDLDTFTLDSIVMGSNLITLNAGQNSFNKTVEFDTQGGEVTVQVAINLDRDTRELSAEFMTIDPSTAFLLMDVTRGLLYPEAGFGNGQGYITYSVELKEELATGEVINNQGDIYFDFNDVIPTPELTYTIDSGTPESRMLAAVAEEDGSITLSWEGADAADGGSGLAGHYIYVSRDGGSFAFWKGFTVEEGTTASFTGVNGSRYDFVSLAVDHVGNVEAKELASEVSATIKGKDVTPPSAAAGLLAVAAGNSAALVWDAVEDTGVISYRVQYVLEGGSWDDAVVIEVGEAPELLLGNMVDGLYAWRVQAVDEAGNASEWTEGEAFRIDTAAPELTAPLLAPSVESRTATIIWAAASDASAVRYELRYRMGADGEWTTKTTEETTLILADLAEGSYSCELRALDVAGNVTEWLPAGSFTVDVTAPEISLSAPVLSPLTSGSTMVSFAWESTEKASYELTVDGKVVYTGAESQYSMALPDGAHSWSVKATDAAGNVSRLVEGTTPVLDATAPVLTLSAPSTTKVGEGSTKVTFAWESSEAATYELTVDGEVIYKGSEAKHAVDLADGTHTWSVKATDAAGNESEIATGEPVTLDATAPVLTVTSQETKKLGEGKTLFTLTWSSNEKSTYALVLDGQSVTLDAGVSSYSVELADGKHSYSLIATDAAGNSCEAQTGELTLDATAPELTLGTPVLSKAGEGKVSVALSWSSTESAAYTLSIDGNSVALDSGATSYTATMEDGEHRYLVTATDAEGNRTELEGSFSYDATAPVLQLNAPEITKVENGKINVTLSWIGEDGANYVVSVDGKATPVYVGVGTSYTFEVADGTHRYSVTATDAAGNSASVDDEFSYDATAPALSLGEPVITKVGNGEISVTLSWVGEDGASYALMVDGENVTLAPGETGCTLMLPDGEHRYEVSATDASGNTATLESSFSYDATAPSAPEASAPTVQDKGGIATFSWSAVEAGASYELRYRQGTEGVWVTQVVGTALCFTLEGLEPAAYEWQICAKDANGNASDWSALQSFTVNEIPLDAPATLGEPSVVDGKTHFTWSAVEGAAAYRVYYKLADGELKSVDTEGATPALALQLADGHYSWSVVAISESGVASEAARGSDFMVDTGVDTQPSALSVKLNEASAMLSWTAATDISGISEYIIEYSRDANFAEESTLSVSTMAPSTSIGINRLMAESTYYWRVAAKDSLGNVSGWEVGSSFEIGKLSDNDAAADATLLTPTGSGGSMSAAIAETVGFGDQQDYFRISPATAAGIYDIRVENMTTPLVLSVGYVGEDGEFELVRALTITPGSPLSGLDGVVIGGEETREVCIRVDAYGDASEAYTTDYTLVVEGEAPGNITADNSPATARQLTWQAEDTEGVRSWVGAGDAVDTYRFTLDKTGSVSLNLAELETSARLRVMRDNGKGGTTQVASLAARRTGLDRELALSAGTYYLQVESYDGGAGRYNTAYTLDLELGKDAEKKQATLASLA